MHLPFLFLLPLIYLSISLHVATASLPNVLTQGSSLFVETKDELVSPNRLFTAGFHKVGENAYCFGVWFSEPMLDGNHTLVWMANRDEPVNGKRSKFSLRKTGNLVLRDVGKRIWSTDTKSSSRLELRLLDSGNLVLARFDSILANKSDYKQSYLWQSFNFPTHTILPNQPFTKDTILISSRSLTNMSSGFYKLYFDNDNIIRLLYNRDEATSVYWPSSYLVSWEARRSSYNSSRLALLDSNGNFTSTDTLRFSTSDYGNTLQRRRLTLDVDGNIRVYTLEKRSWIVSWQAISKTSKVHGICGPNSLCTYTIDSGRRCHCMYGYKAKNHSDLSLGCEPKFDLLDKRENYEFIKLRHVEFYGFDSRYIPNSTLNQCKKVCLEDSNCKAFQLTFHIGMGTFQCYIKILLLNGDYKANSLNTYLKLPKNLVSSYNELYASNEYILDCTSSVIELRRTYEKKSGNGSLKFMLWFSIIFGIIEALCFAFFYYITKQPTSKTTKNYLAISTGFKRFTYNEILKMSHKFREEVGRGGGGIVYKGILPDNRVVAIKKLHEALQGEAEFLAEISIIGRINHRNLLQTYGYCVEGKHKIVVYEYMENGSLARNLVDSHLNWKRRIEISIGIAKGLAYLHEECLEWVLHCDVKPHNILLDANFNPKVADFGLSKLFHQGDIANPNFSRIRGTRGYMAPEWVFNHPITSKVDVYSYGMVVLEMITGRSPTIEQTSDGDEQMEQKSLVSWVRKKVLEASKSLRETDIKEILDPVISDEYEMFEMKNLLKLALRCVEEDKDNRPTMSEVVKMLLHVEMND